MPYSNGSSHSAHDISPPSSEESSSAASSSMRTAPHSPSPGNVESPLLPPTSASMPSSPITSTSNVQSLASAPAGINGAPVRSSSASYISSPLNPMANFHGQPRSRPVSRGSAFLSRLASEETAAFQGLAPGSRGSMLLYRLASDDDKDLNSQALLAPGRDFESKRFSIGSESVFSFDSKYPTATPRGMVPYVYDPELDDDGLDAADDELHRIEDPGFTWSWRGFANIGLLLLLIGALMCLFILYPVLTFLRSNTINDAIDNNIHINATGQAPSLIALPDLVDTDTPDNVKERKGFDGEEYELVFSDEFNKEGRTFFPGEDPYWEAQDIWYGATADMEWYAPDNAFTRDGHLVLLVENVEWKGLQYRSAMLQSWNKFCFTGGYIEASVSFPGPNEETQGYWPGVWTMGNLGRPGFGASTEGTWPYTYDSCDVGILPNQTFTNGSGPAAALHTDQGREKYNFELSWLPGQKASSCTCEGEDHPGPNHKKGRGAPEIDVLEAQKNKLGPGAKVSQSAQFAPFSHDYIYPNSSQDDWWVYNSAVTQANTYLGSAVQQAVSGLTDVDPQYYNGTGGQFQTFGFEYWSNPQNRDEGFITWMVGDQPTIRMGAGAVVADPLPDGSGVDKRLIPEEPMAIVLNLAISASFQTVDLSTMTFPSEMHIDYIRVYQRKGHTNIGCDPPDYPTADYINRHLNAYTNPNLTSWADAGYSKPKNTMADGCS